VVFSNHQGIVVQQDDPAPAILEIFNLSGQQLFAEDLQDTNHQTLSFRPDAGIYLVKILKNRQQAVVRKILVR